MGMTRKPEGTSGASSGNISLIGANTSSEQAPTAFSSIPVQICHASLSHTTSKEAIGNGNIGHMMLGSVPVKDVHPERQMPLLEQEDDLLI